jgi:asparagine synthase (glutamine-hydrolysing)
VCGIVGIASRAPIPDPGRIVSMRDTMNHRGPDDAGMWVSPEGTVALGHRRLAIIDLSPGGRQPMEDASGRIRVIFNGEIYNYRELRRELEQRGRRFRTASDTEVLLEAYREWGAGCLSRFNGMFAFGLYDGGARRILLARDPAGEKPLFYRHAGGRLSFASELKALLADPSVPREIDAASLDAYLAYGCVPGNRCILSGIRKLPQGHALTYDLDGDALRTWAYWELPSPVSGPEPDPEALREELDRLLLDSVRLRMIADVPVGILLSGGLDSSLVTAMAARASSGPVKTFTVRFPGHAAFDEGAQARIVADHFGTDHAELPVEPASPELLGVLARQFDEPIGDHAIVPTYLLSRAIRPHAKVALTGDGGDELFGGYRHYNLLLRLDRLRPLVPAGVRSLLGSFAARRLPVGTRGRHHAIGFAGGGSRSLSHVNLFFDEVSRGRLLSPLLRSRGAFAASPEGEKERLCSAGATSLQEATRLDFRTTLVDLYLVKVDRASMLASLEARAPFLDRRLVEFAFGRVPDRLRATTTERKVLLRRLARKLLPPALDVERKQGFTMPLADWFRGEWGKTVRSILDEADPGLFDPGTVRGLLEGQKKGYANSDRLFLLTMFELWRREYRAVVPAGSGAP